MKRALLWIVAVAVFVVGIGIQPEIFVSRAPIAHAQAYLNTSPGILFQVGQFALTVVPAASIQSNRTITVPDPGTSASQVFLQRPAVTPTAATSTQGGSGQPAPTFGAGSTDSRGTVFWGTGTGAVSGVQVQVVFATPYASTPAVTISPATAATVTPTSSCENPYVTATSPNGFSVACAGAPTSSQGAGTFGVQYQVQP